MNNGINFPSLEAEEAFHFSPPLVVFSLNLSVKIERKKIVMKEVKLAKSTFLVL